MNLQTRMSYIRRQTGNVVPPSPMPPEQAREQAHLWRQAAQDADISPDVIVARLELAARYERMAEEGSA